MVPKEELIDGATEQLRAALETDDPAEKDFHIRSALQRYDIIENDDMYSEAAADRSVQIDQ